MNEHKFDYHNRTIVDDDFKYSQNDKLFTGIGFSILFIICTGITGISYYYCYSNEYSYYNNYCNINTDNDDNTQDVLLANDGLDDKE